MNTEWINNQIVFWYGNLWELARNENWTQIRKKLETTPYFNKLTKGILNVTDDDVSKIEKKYLRGQYRFAENARVIREIQAITPKSSYLYPVFMVDMIGTDCFGLITYNRLQREPNSLLWPLNYHFKENTKGFEDKTMWKDKKFMVVYRGADSSPAQSKTFKPSRLEIVSRNINLPETDLGLTNITNFIKHGIKEEEVRPYLRDKLSITKQMENKFILCLEGADIASSFGWVLASGSVPIHTYPFCHEVWYFNGLQPWVHFLPLKHDGSDLKEIMQWARDHDQECQTIAQAGRQHMLKMNDPTLINQIKEEVVKRWKLV